ncbi:MAG: hypothetical protein LQ352_005186 [Teloschistes flavicans]|nr:MAG: hypothetical protein LQ352_005186 [Teloschistes flavicans]
MTGTVTPLRHTRSAYSVSMIIYYHITFPKSGLLSPATAPIASPRDTPIALFLSLLPLFAHALPTTTATTSPQTQDNNKPRHTRSFILSSRVLSSPSANPAFDNLVLEPYHIYPAFNYATLNKKSTQNQGVTGFLNGTKQQLDDEQGYLAFDFGQGGVYGFKIDSVNATFNPIEINAGPGTDGMYIDQGVIKYNNPTSGGFYGRVLPPSPFPLALRWIKATLS